MKYKGYLQVILICSEFIMEDSASEPCTGTIGNADKKTDSDESCVSLARSDSGQGKSMSSVDFHEENTFPDEAKQLDPMTEIGDTTENVIFEEKTPLKTNSGHAIFTDQGTGVCINTDSGTEKSPVSQHFEFSNSSIHHLPEISSENVFYRKHQKDMFEGPVSDLSDTSRSKSEKSSLKRQVSFDIPQFDSFDFTSFVKDKPICELESKTKHPSPEVSVSSSRDSCGNYHLVSSDLNKVLVSTANGNIISPHINVLNKLQAQIDVNGCNTDNYTTNPYPAGIQNGSGQHLTSALSEASSPVCHMPPQGMVPHWILDNVVKELTLAKNKISELEHENTKLCRNNAGLAKEYKTVCESRQLQLHYFEQRMSDLDHDASDWKNKYYEIKEQLETKERELQAKLQEINLLRADLACLESVRHDLEVKDSELQTLRERCQVLRFQKEGLESMVSKSSMSDELHNHLQSVVRVRPVANSSDETQVKTL